MKTKYWICLLSALALLCLCLALLLPGQIPPKAQALVYSHGELMMTVDLSVDGSYCVENGPCRNVLTVKDGKISVTDANCAGGDCMRHAPSNGGAPIVCLPNRMVVEFGGEEIFDAYLQ